MFEAASGIKMVDSSEQPSIVATRKLDPLNHVH